MPAASALEGIRVIDFGQYIAGPMAAMLLADHGADVIRIDPPGGPRFDTPANATWNRGKRSIVLDLKNRIDLGTARKLIETADVVIENFRPGVMDRLELGAEAMIAISPRLVYCSLPGFASDDPRAGVKAWEGVLGASTACYAPDAAHNPGRPIYTIIPYSSVFGAFLAATSVAMALNARDRSGKGQAMEIPLFNATFTALSGRGMKIHNSPEVATVSTKWRHGLCKNGGWFMYPAEEKMLAAVLNQGGGMEKSSTVRLSLEELVTRANEIFLTRTAREWEDFCAQRGLEGVPCNTGAEWLSHPHALASEIVADFTDPELGNFRGPGINARLSETPGAVRRPRPMPDQHRAEILAELSQPGLSPRVPMPASTEVMETLRSALQGVRVLDLGIILAAPACGRTLAEFGADVIKIDSPHRNPVSWHCDINRGKRSIVFDLKKEEGLEIFWRLLEGADVVVENFRQGVAEKLGIGYEAVRARRPDIVYCSMNAFGQAGPYARRPGRDLIAQAISGMEERLGGNKPAHAPFNSSDYGTGLMGCYAVALALFSRRRTGKGQRVDSALAYTATMLQSGVLQAYEGKQWDEPRGRILGRNPLYRAYQASDGWIFMAAHRGDLARCLEFHDIADAAATDLERALESRFRDKSANAWVMALAKADIGAHEIVSSIPELMEDALVRAHGLSITRVHDEIGPVTTTGAAIKLSVTPVMTGRPAPKPGADAASILREIGMEGEMERLIQEGTVVVDGIEPGGAS